MLASDGTCVEPCGQEICPGGPCAGVECLAGTSLNEETCSCDPDPCDCSLEPVPFGATGLEGHHVIVGGGFACECVPTGCNAGFEIVGSGCREECPQSWVRGDDGECRPAPTESDCCTEPAHPLCIRVSCAACPIAHDGTDLRAIGKCYDPPARNTCIECHSGIEDPHPWYGGPELTCAGCHGGDPEQSERALAHVPLPSEWQVGSPVLGRPNQRHYYNYLTLAGAERFDGGLEWLRFRDPGDLRIADLTCGKSDCHDQRVENVRRSLMATAAGVVDGARAAAGLPRAIVRGNGGIYKLDATTGMTGGEPELTARVHDPDEVGSVDRIAPFAPPDRAALSSYGELDLLEEVYDKACGGCHLYSAGRNDRYGDFRGSGCSACHMSYGYDGRSRSNDDRVRKDEPTYPAAYTSIAGFDPRDLESTSWRGPERPHPRYHRLTTQISSQRCGTCHSGSNHTDWQFRGYQIDPNRTATRALGLLEVQFTDEIDNQADPFARLHGLAQNQILSFVDWNGDGRDDIPADVHYTAGLECADCHTSAEMHNELKRVKVARVSDWSDPEQVEDLSGALWSRQEQATEIECAHCHGTLDARALPFAADNRNPIRTLIACPEEGEIIPEYQTPAECNQLGRGRFMLSRFSGRWHYVPQVRDTVDPFGPAVAGSYSLEASIFHGRVNGDTGDGAGPCIDGDPARCFLDQVAETGVVSSGFTHLDGLECTACHAAWTNACFGCHVTVDDTGGARSFSPSTGAYTLGRVVQAELTWVSPLDGQLGIDSEGKVAPFVNAGGLRLRHVRADGEDWFGRRRLVAGDPSIRYNVYRHRTGYGLRPYDQESAGLLPNVDGPVFEQRPEMIPNAAFGFNPMTPHTVQRAHPRMDCTACHANGDGAEEKDARFGVRPSGFGGLSAYLDRLDGLEIVRAQSGQRVAIDAALGYRLDGSVDPEGRTVTAQLDRVASPTGFPYASTNHPLRAQLDDRHRRDFPTIAPLAGPLGPNLLLLMSDIVVLPRGVN